MLCMPHMEGLAGRAAGGAGAGIHAYVSLFGGWRNGRGGRGRTICRGIGERSTDAGAARRAAGRCEGHGRAYQGVAAHGMAMHGIAWHSAPSHTIVPSAPVLVMRSARRPADMCDHMVCYDTPDCYHMPPSVSLRNCAYLPYIGTPRVSETPRELAWAWHL